MNSLGKHFFAGTGFSQQENRHIAAGRQPCPALDLQSCRTGPDKIAKTVTGAPGFPGQSLAGRCQILVQSPVLGNQRCQRLQIVVQHKRNGTDNLAPIVKIGQPCHHQLLLVMFHDVQQQGFTRLNHLGHSGMGDQLAHRFANHCRRITKTQKMGITAVDPGDAGTPVDSDRSGTGFLKHREQGFDQVPGQSTLVLVGKQLCHVPRTNGSNVIHGINPGTRQAGCSHGSIWGPRIGGKRSRPDTGPATGSFIPESGPGHQQRRYGLRHPARG